MDFWNMAFWNVVCLVVIFGLAVVFPAISLVVSVRGLGSDALNEKQRSAGEQELRKAGIVREGEEWEARDLDELMLNVRQYDQWKSIGYATTLLLTAGVGTIVLAVIARGSIITSLYVLPAVALLSGAIKLGLSVGYIMGDRHFMTRAGTLLAPPADAIFSRAGGVLRRPWWLRVLDVGLIAGVIFSTLLYAIGKGGTLENATTSLAIARHPWLIWCIPVALCVIMAAQELQMRWEIRRPPLRLIEQPELAGRADLHRRREACKGLYDSTSVFVIPWLSIYDLSKFMGVVGFSPLFLAAFGILIAGEFAYGLTDSRRKRQARIAGGTGYEEVNGTA